MTVSEGLHKLYKAHTAELMVKKTQAWLMFSLCIWGQDPSLNTDRESTEKKNKQSRLLTHGYHGHYLSYLPKAVREELSWKSSILLRGEKVCEVTIQELLQASIFSQDQTREKQRS